MFAGVVGVVFVVVAVAVVVVVAVAVVVVVVVVVLLLVFLSSFNVSFCQNRNGEKTEKKQHKKTH